MPNQYIFDDSGPATYEFRDSTAPLQDYRRGGKPRSRQNSYGDDDGTGSLTYSAASSITVESTDSSFAGIKKVLELHSETSKDLASYVRKQHRSTAGDESCTADSLAYSAKSATSDSLAYSVDAESYMRSLAADGEASYRSRLQGTALLSTGHQSSQSGYDGGSNASALGASYLNNGGGQRHDIGADGNLHMMFSPAEHTDSMKRRKDKKRRERREQGLSTSSSSIGQSSDTRDDKGSQPVNVISPQTTPTRSSRQHTLEPPAPPVGGRIVSPTFWPDDRPAPATHFDSDPSPKPSPPRTASRRESPRPPLHRGHEDMASDEDDVWYAKWWTLCFPDALQSVDPKR